MWKVIRVPREDARRAICYYRDAFGLVEIGRHDSDVARAVFLSDGAMRIAVVSFHPELKHGRARAPRPRRRLAPRAGSCRPSRG